MGCSHSSRGKNSVHATLKQRWVDRAPVFCFSLSLCTAWRVKLSLLLPRAMSREVEKKLEDCGWRPLLAPQCPPPPPPPPTFSCAPACTFNPPSHPHPPPF
eukprot:2186974-Pleurochrysis_carterae.AAC.3